MGRKKREIEDDGAGVPTLEGVEPEEAEAKPADDGSFEVSVVVRLNPRVGRKGASVPGLSLNERRANALAAVVAGARKQKLPNGKEVSSMDDGVLLLLDMVADAAQI